MIKLLIGGDVCPRGKVGSCFSRGDSDGIFHDLAVEFEKADLSIVNLECPFIVRKTPIKKSGSVLGVESSCVNGLVKSGIDVAVLANNHILDHGESGLKNTLEVCSKAGLLTVGAGKNIEYANKMLIKEVDGVRIGIYAMAEHEFSIATENSYGANPLDLINFIRIVEAQKPNYDYLIVIIHGGNEHYPYPSPGLMKRCRFIVEMGANTVICQHSHCPGCHEEYSDSHIVYGQGNLIFEPIAYNPESWYKGYLLKLKISDNLSTTKQIIPYIQSYSFIGAKRMNIDEEKAFLQIISKRSQAIKDKAFVEKQWRQFCEKLKYSYIGRTMGYRHIMNRLNRNNGLITKLFHSQRALRVAYNLIRCEAHREVIETVLGEYLKGN